VKQALDVEPIRVPHVSHHDLKAIYDMVAAKASNVEKASVGLFTYPVLMAADILAYKSTHVPVGDDQRQHLNLARDIAQKFNSDYQHDFFPIPEAVFSRAPRVMSLQDASRKMSKSDPDVRSRISFSDSDDVIASKIRRATADTLPFPSSSEEITKPEIDNLITIYCECMGTSRDLVFRDFGGRGYGVFKPALVGAVVSLVSPIRDEMTRLCKDDRAFLEDVLDQGAERAEA
jgi:tryptophanyl-tRNA synthetase